jgi:hypothetical protein
MRDLRRDHLDMDEMGVCYIAAAVVGAVGSVVGGAVKAGAANKAAAQNKQIYTDAQGNLNPFVQGGQTDFSQYNSMPAFNFNDTQQQLEQTPGYQFALSQGLKSVQNSATARGLGVSGAAQKGAATYATGLADQTYQNQFGNALNTYNTNANKLLQGAQIGQSAATNLGVIGAKTAENQGNATQNAGNAFGSGLTGATNIFSNYLLG